jgi:hypothetical protein
LQKSRSKIGISDEELFEDIENVWMKLGKQPSYSQMRDNSKFSIGTYEKRFGGWRSTLSEFINYINCPTNSETINQQNKNEGKEFVSSVTQENSQHKTSRNVNLRTRFIVLSRDRFCCCTCGASPSKDPSIQLQVDHIVPWSLGGETVIENLQTLCQKCNIGKSNTTS